MHSSCVSLFAVITVLLAGLKYKHRRPKILSTPQGSFPDSRIPKLIQKELSTSAKYILHVGSGDGELVRLLHSEFPSALLVAVESDSSLSLLGAAETKRLELSESIVHIRIDSSFSVNPSDVIDGHLFDVVILSGGKKEKSAHSVAFATKALKPHGLFVVENSTLPFYFAMQPNFDRFCLAKGLALGEYFAKRWFVQNAIASHQSYVSPSPVSLNLLMYGFRKSGVATQALVTTTVHSKMPRTTPSVGGQKIRVGALVLVSNASSLVLLVSSSKREHEYILPGGGVESEETFSQAVLRECLEEAGVQASVSSYLGPVVAEVGKQTTHFFHLELQTWETDFPEAQHRRRILVDLQDAAHFVNFKPSSLTALELLREEISFA